MRKSFLYIVTIFIFLSLPYLSHGVAKVYIPLSFHDTLLCKGGSFNLPFSVDTDFYYQEGNFFKVQLSNSTGVFSSNTSNDIIGQIGALGTGTVTCTIPSSTPAGTGYRLRIIATKPSEISNDNGKNIRISSYPTATATNNTPICPSGTLQLTGASDAGASGSYSWTGPNGYTSNQQNPGYNQPPTTATGVYTLKVTKYGCSTTDTTMVNVVNPPEPWIRPQGPIYVCEAGSVSIDAQDTSSISSLVNISWISGPGNFVPVNWPVFHRHNATKDFEGIYVVQSQVGSCIKTDSVMVYIMPRPDTPVANSNSPVCEGATLKLEGSSTDNNITYEWTGPNSFFAAQQKPTIPNITHADSGNYILVAVFSNGCRSEKAKIKVLTGTPISAPIVKGDVVLCKGEVLKLTANGSFTNAGEFKWTYPSGINSLGKTLTINGVVKSDEGQYSVIQSYMGCVSPPTSVYTDITEVPVPYANSNSPLCDGDTLELRATNIDSATYRWTGPENFTSTDRTPRIAPAGLLQKGSYNVIATLNNCTNTSTVNVKVNPIPLIKTISAQSPICEWDTLVLNAVADIDSCSYTWAGPNGFNSDEQSPKMVAHKEITGTYTVVAEAANCYSDTAYTDVEMRALPAKPVITANGSLEEGDELKLTVSCDTPGVVFLWKGPNGFTATGNQVGKKDITEEDEGVYYVAATKDGCSASALVSITIQSNPDAIYRLYPNPGDGLLTLAGMVHTKTAVSLMVYDAAGQEIYHAKAPVTNNKFSTTIDLRGVASGMYMLHIRTDKETEELKFVITR